MRLKGIITDLYENSHFDACKSLLLHLNDVYAAVQHRFPKLIGTTEKAPHNMSYAVGNDNATCSEGTCEVCEVILRFFKERIPSAIDGRIGLYYSDIIDHCLEKVIIYMGHALRCRVQQIRIKQIMSQSKGKTVVLTLDYMMKLEEQRARESSREHYGKRGIVVHGALVKYMNSDGSYFKRVYMMSPEGDGTQDAKAALANLDVLCYAIKEESCMNLIENIVVLSDNAGTYSANIFNVASFDIVKSHGLTLLGIIHNEAQDGKTELDSSFFHFKNQINKYVIGNKTSVLTPSDMAEAMKYKGGLKNSRFDVILLDRNWLDILLDDKGQFYGLFRQRMKQVLPSNIAEVRTNVSTGVHEVYESSILSPFSFKNDKVKKIDQYMEQHKANFHMSYNFFRSFVKIIISAI
jgi:hypothetical protein